MLFCLFKIHTSDISKLNVFSLIFASDSVIGDVLPTPECATQPPVVVRTVADENTTNSNITVPGKAY